MQDEPEIKSHAANIYRYPRPYRRGAFKIQALLVLYLPSLAFLRIL